VECESQIRHARGVLMDDVRSWWEIAQLAGAGATVVLGPVVLMFWKRIQDDTNYIRESDKNTLTVLRELTASLSTGIRDSSSQHAAILTAIQSAVSHIKEHIDVTRTGRRTG
jgi:hypothetical protein